MIWLDEMFQKGQNGRAVGRVFMMLTMISIGYGNVPKGKKDCQKGQTGEGQNPNFKVQMSNDKDKRLRLRLRNEE
jgi:hypothetical protein